MEDISDIYDIYNITINIQEGYDTFLPFYRQCRNTLKKLRKRFLQTSSALLAVSSRKRYLYLVKRYNHDCSHYFNFSTAISHLRSILRAWEQKNFL